MRCSSKARTTTSASSNCHDRNSGLTEIYLCFAMPGRITHDTEQVLARRGQVHQRHLAAHGGGGIGGARPGIGGGGHPLGTAAPQRGDVPHADGRAGGERAVACFCAAVLTGICLGNVCSRHEILRRHGPGQARGGGSRQDLCAAIKLCTR
jgi:hypothetical protein